MGYKCKFWGFAVRFRRLTAAVVLGGAAALLLAAGPAASEPAGQAGSGKVAVQPAVDGILAAFKDHPLVGIGDRHNLAQQGAFYAALVADPRFARDVGNLVVEFGGAAQQTLIDRYVAGDPIAPHELRNVWSDVVGWEPGEIGQMYVDVFVAVRRANARLPKEKQIKVWLGEPPIDWRKIDKQDDLAPFMAARNAHPAKLIVEQILDRQRKALVIYGGLHFFSRPPMPTSIKTLVERERPGSFYLVTAYSGLATEACSHAFEAQVATWPAPALAAPIGGTWIESALRDAACAPRRPTLAPPGGASPTPVDPDRETRRIEAFSGVLSDALLYVGPAKALRQARPVGAEFVDEAYLVEMRRRGGILGAGRPAPPAKAP